MINQDMMTAIIIKQLKEFDLSKGWIDPDECMEYEEYETNYNGDYFEVADMCQVSFESPDNVYYGKDVRLDKPINIVVKEYEYWEKYCYEFEIPSLLCLTNKKTFTDEFKKAIVKTHEDVRVNNIKDKLSCLNYLSREQLLSLEGEGSVDLRFGIKDWSCEVVSVED